MKRLRLFLFIFLGLSGLSHARSRLSLNWESYVAPPVIEERAQDYVFLNWDSELQVQKNKFDFDASLRIDYGFGNPALLYYDLPELFVRFDSEISIPYVEYFDRIEVAVGRKVKQWSKADEYWDLGLWNSLTVWNPLYPEDNGLIGSFISLEGENVALDMFLGCCYIPNRTPPIKRYEDGKMISRSRWTTPLYESVETESFADIRYLIRRPILSKLLFQESYIISFTTKSSSNDFSHFIKVFFGNKPANQVTLAFTADESFEIKAEEETVFKLSPGVVVIPIRNNILSGEVGVDYKSFSTTFTLENVSTHRTYDVPEAWTLLNWTENFTYFSALLKYNLSKKQFVRLGYIHSWFHNFSEKNSQSSSVISRARNLRGLSFDWSFEYFSSYGLKRKLSLNYQYSIPNEGGLLRINTIFHLTPKFFMTLSTNVLGSALLSRTYFLNVFRHNDYFSWSLNYDF